MTVRISKDDTTKTIELTAAGYVTRADYDGAIDDLQDFIDQHGTIKIIEIIESFDGFDPSAMWSGFKFDMRNIRHISHVAVVSDIGWISPLTKAAGAFVSTKLRTFDLAEVDAARAWIRSVDAAEAGT